jgi:hypothetical protein
VVIDGGVDAPWVLAKIGRSHAPSQETTYDPLSLDLGPCRLAYISGMDVRSVALNHRMPQTIPMLRRT